MQTVTSWQLMTWGSAQAGDRASKTRRYLQWRGHKPEQDAVASALQNLHNSVCYYIVASSYVKILKTGDGKAGGNLDSNAHQEVSLCADFPFAESTVAS